MGNTRLPWTDRPLSAQSVRLVLAIVDKLVFITALLGFGVGNYFFAYYVVYHPKDHAYTKFIRMIKEAPPHCDTCCRTATAKKEYWYKHTVELKKPYYFYHCDNCTPPESVSGFHVHLETVRTILLFIGIPLEYIAYISLLITTVLNICYACGKGPILDDDWFKNSPTLSEFPPRTRSCVSLNLMTFMLLLLAWAFSLNW